MTETISPNELKNLHRSGKIINLVDVRAPAEFRQLYVDFARNIPLNALDPELFRHEQSSEPLYIICQQGGRSRKACQKLAAAGIANVINVEGGTAACAAAGLPLARGKTTISLERQIRIAAGSLVLLGSLLAWLVHPAFLGLSAFIGAGLVFAGITNTCGMGMMLARMPWNQIQGEEQHTASKVETGSQSKECAT
jgi:rhodanese-related sulfurtransferase